MHFQLITGLRKDLKHMTQPSEPRRQKWEHEGLISAIGFGGFLIMLGFVFAFTPDLLQKISSFFGDLAVQRLPFSSIGNVMLPAPRHPAAHIDLYNAVMQFDIGIAILQIVILALRFGLVARTRRIAETIGNLVFWAGAAITVNTFLLMGTLTGWFEYWAALIIVIGVSIVARALVHFVRRK